MPERESMRERLSLFLNQNFLKRVVTSFILGLGFWLSFIYLPPVYFSLILALILLRIILFEWVQFFNVHHWSFWLILPLYPILPFALLILMNQDPIYRGLLLELFIIVASLDTGSYMVGTLFGKHRIAPAVSQNKTWEGFAGGYLFALIGLSAFVWYEQQTMLPLWFLMGFTLIVCLLALAGDLFESWLKRMAGLKDSGDILPGHGGFLDRFDGIMFATFFFYAFKTYLVKIFG